MDDYLKANRENWNERTPIHARSEFYDVEGFKAGRSTLTSIELEEVGDVAGRSLLHLQCHFGLDTMSWARLGARVTGVDFSDEAVELARSLSRETGIEADFVLSSIYELPGVLEEKYDVVFTSYGVLNWLPDLTQWAQVIARFLKPGGTFYIVEFHPFADVFYDESDAVDLRVHSPYFQLGRPTRYEPDGSGSYAGPDTPLTTTTYEWQHTMGDIVNSLISAGLRIEFLHEFPYSVLQQLPAMERGEDGWWRLNEGDNLVPLLFSLKAIG